MGFPGESDEEFEITKQFLKKIHFYEMHIFKYSKRQGTRAAVMPNQIPEEVKTKRSTILIEQGERMSGEFRDYYIGTTQEVLFEEKNIIDGEEYFVGYTKEYVKIAVKTNENLENVLIEGQITGRLSNEVYEMSVL